MKAPVLLLSLAVLAGCSNPFDSKPLPPLVGDIYILTSIASVPLPAPVVKNGDKIVADTIALSADGTGVHRRVYDVEASSKSADRNESKLTYRVSNDQIVINYVCTDRSSACAPEPHVLGTVTAQGITTIDYTAPHVLKPLVYRRSLP